VRRGRGFAYLDAGGVAVNDEAELARIQALAIPPAWTDVWISGHPNGHIQATGLDAAGRRQYLYHSVWRERADRSKHERALDLAEALPSARRGVTRDLRGTGLGRDRVLAGAFRLLDAGCLRVGSRQYAEEHGSYGLTTLLGSHARVRDDIVELRFPGKSGQVWQSEIPDPDLAALLGELRQRGGRARLLAWRDDAGVWHPLRPEEINADIRARTGGDFTAKDFRTLRGSATAATSLARSGIRPTAAARKRVEAAAMRHVSAVLGNTPAVARSSYVDPRIVDHYEHGEVIDPTRGAEPQIVAMLRVTA
jgi:DNA topoisomerase-1